MEDQRYILLIEDNPGDVRLAELVLQKAHLSVKLLHESNGDAAIDFLLNWKSSRSPQKIELVVLDLNLPKKDGFEVLKMIKADASLRDLPVVIFTSSEADSDVKRACDLKADGYILKGPGFKDFKDGFLQALDYWLSKDRLKNDLVDLR